MAKTLTEVPMANRADGIKADLLAPHSYWAASPLERARVCNGAGPRWLDEYLPWWARWLRIGVNRLWGLNCRQAFDIHDWDYAKLPATPEAKAEADDRLDFNLHALIEAAGGPEWLKRLRRREAMRYVWLVRFFGFKAFFDRG